MNDYQKFKHLLEYFVAHLEYVVNEDPKMDGYETYIKFLVENDSFYKQGQGHKGANIQKQIEEWDSYSNGYSIKINISGASKVPYQNNACYLNWEKTWVNVRPDWKNNHVINLYLSTEQHSGARSEGEKSIEELGLFDNNEPNDDLNSFFDKFKEKLNEYLKLQKNKAMKEHIKTYTGLLSANRSLILTGAPGTGKTYLAKQIAQQLIFGEVKETMSDDEKKQFNEQCDFVQFHPSYDYTDFVEGLRPKQDDNGNIGFERKNGVFKDFCAKAIAKKINEENTFDEVWNKLITEIRVNLSKGKLTKIGSWEYGLSTKDSLKYSSIDTPSQYSFTITKKNIWDTYCGRQARPSGAFQKDMQDIVDYLKETYQLLDKPNLIENDDKTPPPYIFIIDEINRGEISKIFGELFFSIDPGYRGKKGKVKTQYQNLIEEDDEFYDGFYVPENVYIIGTMNDIDRSVESMDFAFRRRFAFKEIKAMDRVEMLDELPQKEIAINRMKNLNKAIEGIEGLSAAYHIGPAYFLKLKNYNGNFQQLWENHLEGLLREYLRGMQNLEENLKTLKAAYDNESDSANGQQQE